MIFFKHPLFNSAGPSWVDKTSDTYWTIFSNYGNWTGSVWEPGTASSLYIILEPGSWATSFYPEKARITFTLDSTQDIDSYFRTSRGHMIGRYQENNVSAGTHEEELIMDYTYGDIASLSFGLETANSGVVSKIEFLI